MPPTVGQRLVLGEPRQRAISRYDHFAAVVLPLFGRGPVLDLGAAEPAVLEAWRWRGVTVDAFDVTSAGALTRLPYPNDAFNTCVALHVLEHLEPDALEATLLELARVTRQCVFVRISTLATSGTRARLEQPRSWWETQFFRAGFAKHPLHMQLTPYETLESEGDVTLSFVRLPQAAASRFPLASLRNERDLHMDMLRESGRRADAHVARYVLAAGFVRPRDRVLDAACGLGYGTAILNDATRAASVTGIDSSSFAIEYAKLNFEASRTHVTFAQEDVVALESMSRGSLDVVISFETLEHIAEPRRFVLAAALALTPGGRFICSVPNRWVDDTGRDPNPHHLHIFDARSLLALFGDQFRIERVFGQTAGGGMKHFEGPRAIVEMNPDDPDADPEWWIVVAMRTPLSDLDVPFREAESGHPEAPTWNVTAIERDYENPWLVRALVTRGFRASSTTLLIEIARDVAGAAPLQSPDRGAALCVQAYAALAGETALPDRLLEQLAAYCDGSAGVPHVERWRISNEYVLARLLLQRGHTPAAEQRFIGCATKDCLRFGPLLATKTVDAAFWAGWLAFQRGAEADARHWWSLGIQNAEAAVRAPWRDVLGSVDEPLLFGLRELAQVIDSASRCASGLHALSVHAGQPATVASLAFHSMAEHVAARGRLLDLVRDEVHAERHRFLVLEHVHHEAMRGYEAELQSVTRLFETERDRGTSLEREHSAEIAQLRAELHAERQNLRRRQRDLALLIDRLPDRRGVGIFGAGEGGRRFATQWRRAGGAITFFLDNDRCRWETYLDGVPIVAPARLNHSDLALIVIASSPGYQQIVAQLNGMGLPAGLEFVDGTVFGPEG